MKRSEEETLERATRAVMEVQGFSFTGDGWLIDQHNNPRIQGFIRVARAVLAAPRSRKSIPQRGPRP